MRFRLFLALVVGLACVAEAFEIELQISQAPDGHQELSGLRGGGGVNRLRDDEFLSRMRQHMRSIAQASHHVHRSPLDGMLSSIDHIFDDRNLDQDPLSALHEVASRASEEEYEPERRHENFMRGARAPPEENPFAAIMELMHKMVQPMLAPQLEIVQGPPRGLVAMACHQDAINYCRRFCSCWKGMTTCLAKHRQDLAPQCKHMLQVSGIIGQEQPKVVTKPDLKEDSGPPRPLQRPLDIMPLSMRSSLQQIHDSVTEHKKAMAKAAQSTTSSKPLQARTRQDTREATVAKVAAGTQLQDKSKSTPATAKQEPSAPVSKAASKEARREGPKTLFEKLKAWLTTPITITFDAEHQITRPVYKLISLAIGLFLFMASCYCFAKTREFQKRENLTKQYTRLRISAAKERLQLRQLAAAGGAAAEQV